MEKNAIIFDKIVKKMPKNLVKSNNCCTFAALLRRAFLFG